MSKTFSILFRTLLWLGRAGWLLLLVQRATVRDTLGPASAVAFYATPLPLLAAGGLVMAGWFAGWGRSWRALRVEPWLWLVGAGVASLWWVGQSWSFGPATTAASSPAGSVARVGFWNLSWPDRHPWPPLVDWVRAGQHDAVICAEIGRHGMTSLKSYETALPGYHVVTLPYGMMCLSRTKATVLTSERFQPGGACAVLGLKLGGVEARLVAADVHPSIFAPRAVPLERTLALAEKHRKVAQGKLPCLIVGDFNTPGESAYFDPYRRWGSDALPTAGVGWSETWPVGLPLLSLDHLWLSQDLTLLGAKKTSLPRLSDHARVEAEFRVLPLK